MERFLDTDNAALLSMHYPQGQRDFHAGTAPFDNGREREGEEKGDGEGEQEGGETRAAGGEDRRGGGPRGLFGE